MVSKIISVLWARLSSPQIILHKFYSQMGKINKLTIQRVLASESTLLKCIKETWTSGTAFLLEIKGLSQCAVKSDSRYEDIFPLELKFLSCFRLFFFCFITLIFPKYKPGIKILGEG